MFLIFILVQRHVTFKLSVFHLWQMISAFYKELTAPHQPPYGSNFSVICLW